MVKPFFVVPDVVRTNVVASINFNVSGGASCTATIFGSGTTSLTIASQTGNTFSGGKFTFMDMQGHIVTIIFSGSVNSVGAVTGAFTLDIKQGATTVGTGSGTFSGTATQGTSGPGSFHITLNGTTMITGAGTCNVTAHVDFTGS
jgi:hypothetical protein